jgi:1-aminocyclopropane-1-carboxylate deaminase/D-cysteine desulfhydrase-like pyridoxal-dependent ACC family enzyme
MPLDAINFPSPLQKITFDNRTFYIKRDDLLHPYFSGNKARKLFFYLEHFDPTITEIISYGSVQSNAMLSISYLAKLKHIQFTYIVDHLPPTLQKDPVGNFQKALEFGMQLIVNSSTYHKAKKRELPEKSTQLFIPEGVAIPQASYGMNILANELKKDLKYLNNPLLFLPSGTGTTALFLQNYLPYEVYTTAVVGNEHYLKEQWDILDIDAKQPTILMTQKHHKFGKCYPEFFSLFQQLYQETAIEFDLLYDPKGWSTLLEHRDQFGNRDIVYLHQGGLIGNISMRERYKRL